MLGLHKGGSGKRFSMTILIQYEGFTVSPASRTYNFHVTNVPGESRQFAVRVPAESFRLTSLKFQDGPAICFERLQHEIDAETQDVHAEAVLNISASEIREYLDRQHPAKARHKQRVANSLPVTQPPNPLFLHGGSDQMLTKKVDSGERKAEAAELELRDAQHEEIARLEKRIDEINGLAWTARKAP